MKKEQELAEKRKNDPPLELSIDHPVRKLISRFRKISDTKSMQSNTDPEKGHNSSDGPDKPRSFARLINVSENSTPVIKPKLGGGSSKWGKMMNGSGPPQDVITENKQNNLNHDKEEKISAAPKATVKPLSKWNRMMGKTPETISEAPEEENKINNLKRDDPHDLGLTRGSTKMDHTNEEVNENQVVIRDISVGSMSVAEKHVLTSLYDIRLEIREEMDGLHQKMNRIDEQISEMLRLFSPSSTPCSSHSSQTSTYPTSKITSPRNTTSNSVDPSPKSSVESSPKRRVADVTFSSKTSISSDGSKEVSHSKDCTTQSHSPRSSAGSRVATPIGHVTPVSEASVQSNVLSMVDDVLKMNMKSKLSSDGRPNKMSLRYSSNSHEKRPVSPKVSLESDKSDDKSANDTKDNKAKTKDDENAHVKDRDLDIL